MKNKNILNKILFYIQMLALVFLAISVFLFVWAVFISPNNNIIIIMFGLVGDTLVFLFAIIFFLLEFIYALLFGIIKDKIHITFLSVFILFFVLVNFFYMGLTYEEVEYKVEIEEVNELIAISEVTSLHDTIDNVYEKKFFVFYKEIFSDYNASLSSTKYSEIVYEDNMLIFKYTNDQSEYADSYIICYFEHKNNEFVLVK